MGFLGDCVMNTFLRVLKNLVLAFMCFGGQFLLLAGVGMIVRAPLLSVVDGQLPERVIQEIGAALIFMGVAVAVLSYLAMDLIIRHTRGLPINRLSFAGRICGPIYIAWYLLRLQDGAHVPYLLIAAALWYLASLGAHLYERWLQKTAHPRVAL